MKLAPQHLLYHDHPPRHVLLGFSTLDCERGNRAKRAKRQKTRSRGEAGKETGKEEGTAFSFEPDVFG